MPIVLGVQINHILANRSELDPFFNFAFFPENEGLTVFFGALVSSMLMFPLLYLIRWRVISDQRGGWARKVFRPNILELNENRPLGRTVLRVILIFGIVLPMLHHVWLVDRALKDPDVYIRICAQDTEKENPFTDLAVLKVYPQIGKTDYFSCQKVIEDSSQWTGIARCIDSAGAYYCRIATNRAGHFQFPTSVPLWGVLFGGGRESFMLGYEDRVVSYVPSLFPGMGLTVCVLLVFYWIDTLAMIFVPRIRLWPRRPSLD